MRYWFVIVQKVGSKKRHIRRIPAKDEQRAFELTAQLIGGPNAANYELISVKPA